MRVAVMGYGTIGSGVVQILDENSQVIEKQTGEPVELAYVLDLRDFPGDPVQEKIVHDFSVILEDSSVELVVEAMGGLNPAYPFVKASLEAGKHVVTSNKALVAAHGTELLEIAADRQVNFLFEASVGGGIPIIRPLYQCLMGEKIEEITGILNGTTNYILTKMDREGESFETALKQAQDLGYAERNPEADVEGYDTCRKIAILTAMAVGKEVNYEDIYTEGITKITDVDFKYAAKLQASVKLVGSSRMEDGRVHAWVAPLMMNASDPLYGVSDVFNGIVVKGNMLGTSMFYGSGAGKLPTASAVVADIIEAARNKNRHVPLGWTAEKQQIEPMDTAVFSYFVRVQGSVEKRGALVREKLGQVQLLELENLDEFGLLTGPMTEAEFKKRAVSLDSVLQAEGSDGIRQMIRTEL